MEMNSGSIGENTKRLERLYKKHHLWLLGTAFNVSKDEELSADLVQDLYLYLGERVNPKLWYDDSFNILYCIQFIKTRYINKIKRANKIVTKDSFINTEWEEQADTEYNEEWDLGIDKAYDDVLEQITAMEKTKMFVSAKLYKLYWIEHPDETLEGISKKIGISNSTAFLHIKKFKGHLKEVIKSPFDNE